MTKEIIIVLCPYSASFDCPCNCSNCIHGDNVEFIETTEEEFYHE